MPNLTKLTQNFTFVIHKRDEQMEASKVETFGERNKVKFIKTLVFFSSCMSYLENVTSSDIKYFEI